MQEKAYRGLAGDRRIGGKNALEPLGNAVFSRLMDVLLPKLCNLRGGYVQC